MSNYVPRAEWAAEKVRIFVPVSKEKSTLIAIAGHVDYRTNRACVSIGKLSFDTGHSESTVKRHIRALERQGHLVVDRPDQYEHRPSYYIIPCCSLSRDELELITGISGNQLNLGLIDPDQPGKLTIGDNIPLSVAERQWGSNCTPMGVNLNPYGGQIDPPLMVSHEISRVSRENSLRNAGVTLAKPKPKPVPIEEAPAGPIADATRDLIAATVEKLRSSL